MAEPLHIVWFKRDLRVADHAPLAQAAAMGRVLPIYIAEPEYWQLPDSAGRHWAFVAQCLVELQRDLAALGQPLVVRVGDAVEVLDDLRKRAPIAGLWSHMETGNGWTFARDVRVAEWARDHGIAWHEPRPFGVVRRLASRDGWAAQWDRQMASAQVTPTALTPLGDIGSDTVPTAPDLGMRSDPCPMIQPGGRAAGSERLQSFLTIRGAPYRRAMSSPGPGAIACSRVSPHLTWGSLSMREVAQATWARQRDLKQTPERVKSWPGAMRSFNGRLHWHCHFMQKLEDQPNLEHKNLHPAYNGVARDSDAERLHAWSVGETGLPFVDACMRALNATGWMNFRMRAMLVAVASYHLWLDWRATGQHLARAFTDYEPGIHWSQVQMQSGTTGINTIRIYNPVKQGQDQDPKGDFIRKWVPELRAFAGAEVHMPWMSEQAETVLGRTYPHPIVDHMEAAREARARIWAVRGDTGFHNTAKAITQKHGSRKSGIPMRGQKTRRKPDDGQMAFRFDTPEGT